MSSFILDHLEEIVSSWEDFARTLTPAATSMDSVALRDHAKQMLEAIAKDIRTAQTAGEQELKSKGLGPVLHGGETAAAAHGLLRQRVGFDLAQLVAEFRALRASVLKLWLEKKRFTDEQSAYEIARFNEAIDQALAESVATYSKELSRSRDTFLGVLGHDLRSPLRAISSVMDLLANSNDPAAREKGLATGRRSLAAMDAMIRDLLEYTRTRLGAGIPVEPAPADLDVLCRGAVNEVSMVFPQTAFRYESSGHLDGVFDAKRMHQVVSNLLNNAVQHGRAGTPVTLAVNGTEEGLTLRVTNTGPAIAPSNLKNIFEPLVQGENADDAIARSTSLGLGLFISREIVLAHGGEIEVSSTDREGTSFELKLPRPPSSASSSADGAARGQALRHQ